VVVVVVVVVVIVVVVGVVVFIVQNQTHFHLPGGTTSIIQG